MNKGIPLIVAIGLMWPCVSFGERLVYKTALEILGNKVNIRGFPGGPVIEQLSTPSIVIQGRHEEEYSEDWTPLVDIAGYEEGVIASKYVRELPYRPFDSSFCGSYMGEGYAELGDYSYSLATIKQKPQGWYVLTITDYSQPNEVGLRSYRTRVLAGRPIHEYEYDDDDRMNNFDGLYFRYELYNESDLDNLDEDGYPNNVLSELDNEYFIVTGPKELCSKYLKLTKD